METILQDLRYGIRILAERPSFSAITILTLALGIGACTALFSIVDAVLLRSLSYPEPDRIIQLRELNEKGHMVQVAEPNFDDLKGQNHSLDSMARFGSDLATVLGGSLP